MANNKDYHGHPNYLMVFIALTVLMIASVFVDKMGLTGATGSIVVYGIAVIKAYLVIANFMHLKYEPKLVDMFPYLSIACMVVLFFGVYPDSAMIHLEIAE